MVDNGRLRLLGLLDSRLLQILGHLLDGLVVLAINLLGVLGIIAAVGVIGAVSLGLFRLELFNLLLGLLDVLFRE